MANQEPTEFEPSPDHEEDLDTALASEPSLGKDWLRSEEDQAWESL
jgi:hypothetical protein